ncbi:MAG: hypothetical protein E7554_05580 [Ruminococcaceae bacterium]|nr:hypothetical protein [Oscillospiraceae bacterium]
MNTSPNKKPLLYIGLILFLVIAVAGFICDIIVSTEPEGIIAIIAVVVAFLILAGFLVIDTVARKRAMAKEEEDGFDADSSIDSRFLRHTEDTGEEEDYVWHPNATARSGFAGFNRRGFEEAAEPTEDAFAPQAAADEFGAEDFGADFDDIPDIDDVSDDEVFSFTDEELEQTSEIEQEPSEPVSEQEEQPVEDIVQDEPQEDDPFKPVLKLNGTQPEEVSQEPETVEQEEQPAAEEAQPADEEPAVVEQPEPEVKAQPAEQPARSAAPQPAAAERRAAAAVPVAAVATAAAVGQTIESFYDEMSDEDILYRDCVEVWAADAKPAALRLIKYVEGIEDKQTAALIGREVEYVNAMIDRINCFTQLEYIDELLEYKEHNYSTLVKDTLKRFSPFFMEKRLGLLWKGLDIDVMTDRRWFIFALTQVIFNAVEFTPNGGKIAISAKKHEDFIDLTVEDSGKGISPEELPFIFMAGYMGDDAPNESGRRTGMGLFIAQSVMRKMGGDMLAESTPGKGTRITMRMPIIEP